MQRYDSYKPSGVKWLGEIPSHWEMISTKYIAKLYTGNSLNDASKEKYSLFSDDSYPYIASKDISLGTGTVDYDNGLYIPKDESFFEIAPKNSFLLCIEGGSAGRKKAFLDRNCCFVNKLCCFDSVLNPKYHYYFIQGDYFRTMFNCSLQGMIGGVSVSALKNFYTIVPPLEEQTAIANYLDTATAKIDAAIAQQQKMIDLLNERKQIIINRAVTKGLNPNAKMKDSGVEWIGEVPEHWEIRKLGTIGSTINGVSHDSSYFGEGEPFVSYSDVYKNYSLPKLVSGLAKSSMQERLIFSVEKGDVFFTRTSETAEEIGFTSTCLETIPNAVFAGFLIRFRPQAGLLDPNFSMYYFRANIHRSFFVKEMNLVIRASLSQQLLRGLPVLLPPLQEQCDISNYLKREINEIDLCLNSKMKQISLLQERKQIIINEVVTGKVRVM